MKKNIITVVLLVIAVIAVVGIKNSKPLPGCSGGVCALPTSQEKMMTKQALPKLLDLGASKCVPCKMMAPILDEMKETFTNQLDVTFIDVWKDQSAGQAYEIRMIPTQIFFDANGKELFRHEGFYSREDILAKWQELGIVLKDKPQEKKE